MWGGKGGVAVSTLTSKKAAWRRTARRAGFRPTTRQAWHSALSSVRAPNRTWKLFSPPRSGSPVTRPAMAERTGRRQFSSPTVAVRRFLYGRYPRTYTRFTSSLSPTRYRCRDESRHGTHECVRHMLPEQRAGMHQEVLRDRPQRKRRKEGQRRDDEYGPREQNHEQNAVRRHGPGGHWHAFLAGQVPSQSQRRNNHQKASDQHFQPQRQIEPWSVGVQPGHGAPIRPDSARVGVKNLAQSVGTAVAQVGNRRARRVPIGMRRKVDQKSGAGDDQVGRGRHYQRQHHHLDIFGFDALAQVFRRAADHQSRDEDGYQHHQDHRENARSRAAKNPLAGLEVQHLNQFGQRRETIVGAVPRAVAGGGADHREQRGARDSKTDFLALHVAAIYPQAIKRGIALLLAGRGDQAAAGEEQEHDGKKGPALPAIVHRLPERVSEGRRNGQDQEHLQQVRDRRSILKRVRRVGVEEAAAIRAE